MNHTFDKKGFWFSVKFLVLPVLLMFGAWEVASSEQKIVITADTFPVMEQVALVAETDRIKAPAADTMRLGFVGDIMLDRGVESSVVKYGGGNFSFVFDEIRYDLQRFDFLFGNLEGPISDKGKNQGSIYSFRMDPSAASALRDAGFDVVTLANNHMSDYGPLALLDTMERLTAAGIGYVGAGKNEDEAYAVKYIDINGTTLAIIGMTEFNPFFRAGEEPGIAIIELAAIDRLIPEADKNADVVIISFHYGKEYEKEPNQFQKEVSRSAIDAGADLVIGHHPHVVEPVEKYKNGYIAYSLGNFVFDQYFSEETMEGGLLEVSLEDGTIADVKLRKIKMNKAYQPMIDREGE